MKIKELDSNINFSWESVRNQLGWGDEDSVDLFESIIGKHSQSEKTALTVIQSNGSSEIYSYAKLSQDVRKFARSLQKMGITKGDRVAGLMPRGYPVVVTILATIQLGAVYVPIFTGFRSDAIQFRLLGSGASVLVTDASVREFVPSSVNIKIITSLSGNDNSHDDYSFWQLIADSEPLETSTLVQRDEVAVIIFTSGSTGQPKGGAVASNFLASVWPYLHYGADLRTTDIFWPTGDPGWGYGFVCYLGALARGATIISAAFNTSYEQCLEVLNKFHVSNMATTPTLLRSLMAAGRDAVEKPENLRCISSCGEPLNGEVVDFFKGNWGIVPMDHFGATEFALPIGNFNLTDMKVFPGSMGKPFPGFDVEILNNEGEPAAIDEVGLLAKKYSKDSLYWLYYWNDEETTQEVKKGDWIITGDLAYKDKLGYFWFKGRQGDIIKSSGYRIGPFEVESALLKHTSVAEAAVIGKDDVLKGQILKAYVVLRPGYKGSEELTLELQNIVKENLGRHLYPKEIEFIDAMPKTETGKIQRYILRNE